VNVTDVHAQLRETYVRLIASSLAVQHYEVKRVANIAGGENIGSLPSTSISLKNVAYETIYRELSRNQIYHLKFVDGGLVQFQYQFDKSGAICKHRLAYFPSPQLPTQEEAPELYEQDQLFADILEQRIVRFPLRFDFDPSNHHEVDHPVSHFTMGQFQNCRMPVTGPITPNSFILFLLRNFYSQVYVANKNRFDKRVKTIATRPTITDNERRIAHFVVP
jgi:hypothetical protein